MQLLTPCTFGNGWLRVLPFGIYAVTLYDKATGEGVRVELDNDKLEPYDAIRSWFLKERPKKEQDTEPAAGQIKEAGESILSFRNVRIRQDMARAPFVRGDHPLPALRLPLPRLLRRDLPLLSGTVPV